MRVVSYFAVFLCGFSLRALRLCVKVSFAREPISGKDAKRRKVRLRGCRDERGISDSRLRIW